MFQMHRYLLESEVSPTSGAVKVPFKNVNFYSNLAGRIPSAHCAQQTSLT